MQSADDTVKIASEYTDKIYLVERKGYVEPARKFAVEMTTGDWVLIVDADELIPLGLKKQLIPLAEDDNVDVVYMPRKNYIMGAWIKNTGWWPDYQPRFFRKGMIDFSDQIHAGSKIDEKARKLFLSDREENAIVHFAYYNVEHFVNKLNAYTSVEAKHLYDDGITFGFKELILSSAREFYNRFFKSKGYKDGYRGFSLSLMMGVYRVLTHIKLWENWQNQGVQVDIRYNELKEEILKKYSE